MEPLISVVIPTYNRAMLVLRAVESVLKAVQQDDEIIVVDDGSTDNTLEVLQRFGDRIRIVEQVHAGAGAARNLGVKLAKHRWVAFLDSDDEWDADKIALQRPLLAGCADIVFLFTDFRVRLINGKYHSRYIRLWSEDPRDWGDILGPPSLYSHFASLPAGRTDFQIFRGNLYHALLLRPYLAAFTFVFRKDAGERVPEFAVDLPTYEDWQFFAEVARQGDGLYLDCETATQHAHPGSRLTDAAHLDQVESRLAVVERVWGRDESFLKAHSALYDEVHQSLQQRRGFLLGRKLARAGRIAEARASFANSSQVPWKYRLLFCFPDVVIYAVMASLTLLDYF